MNCFEQLQQLKIDIRRKFKSFRLFSFQHKLDEKQFNKFISGRMGDGFDEYWDKVLSLFENEPMDNPANITKEIREKIKLNILMNYGSYYNFHRNGLNSDLPLSPM